MTPAEFLAVVLPSPGLGLYCAVELTKKKEHFYAETIDDLIPKIDAWTAASYDVFYGVAAFDTKRGADNAQLLSPKIVMRSLSFITAGPTTRGGEEDSGVRKEK